KASAKIFADMGGFAPTIGIIGTVIGLVHVLENLSQPETLGHLIAGAFVATLWGVMTANVLWLPLANRLKRLTDVECAQLELFIVMFAISQVDQKKFAALRDGLARGFGAPSVAFTDPGSALQDAADAESPVNIGAGVGGHPDDAQDKALKAAVADADRARQQR